MNVVRSPIVLTVIGIGATLVLTAAVVVVLLWFGGGARAVSDNAALIGALIALGGVFTTQMVNSAIDQAQRERELAIADWRAQNEALQAYLDQISDMLLPTEDQPSLYRAQLGDGLSSVARARTLTVLPGLDGNRKARVVHFLHESGLIAKKRPFLDLNGADLSGANLSNAYLRGAYLRSAYLRGADLSGAILRDAYLRDAALRGADLRGADLRGADLTRATLSKVNLTEANLHETAGIINEELEQQTDSLEGAIMPDGSKHP